MNRIKHQSKRSGFTLIEILTVIIILAVLGGIGFGTYMLVIKQSKSTQAKVMIENISASLENRIGQGLTADDIDILKQNSGIVFDIGNLYPNGDGKDGSTISIYAILSGDFDLSGEVDDDRQPMFPQIDPEYAGKGQYLIRQSEEQLKGGRDTTKLIMVDPWNQPLRYKYPGDKNNVENGFDIWSLGPDGFDAGTLNEDGDDGGLDNITNW